MKFSLLYRRPDFVPWEKSDFAPSTPQELESSQLEAAAGCADRGVPEELTFERIMAGTTCAPLTQRDFLNYLIYVEHSAENLQFYMWFKDYERRFNALPASEKALSPEWKPIRGRTSLETASKLGKSETVQFASAVISENAPTIAPRPAMTFPPLSFADSNPFVDDKSERAGSHHTTDSIESAAATGIDRTSTASDRTWIDPSAKAGTVTSVSEVYNSSDQKLQPFTIQPFRAEISRVLCLYFASSGARELNLSYRERNSVLHALANTTHPSAFLPAVKAVEWTLRFQAHPNFVRWSLQNASSTRIWFGKSLGVLLLAVGFLIAVLFVARDHARQLRTLAFIPWFLGVTTLVAAMRGLCVLITCFHNRHLRPWELWDEKDTPTLSDSSDIDIKSHEDYGWKQKYEKRSFLQAIFEREVSVESTVLRRIQNLIFTQSAIAGLVVGGGLTVVFLCI